jgi:hypothetical protein
MTSSHDLDSPRNDRYHVDDAPTVAPGTAFAALLAATLGVVCIVTLAAVALVALFIASLPSPNVS